MKQALCLVLLLLLPRLSMGLSIGSSPVELGLTIPVVPLLYGNELLFQDFRRGGYGIYRCNLSTQVTAELRSNTAFYLYPLGFSGNFFAWIGNRTGIAIYEVKAFDTRNSTERVISTNGAYKEYLSMDHDHVAWTDYRNSTATDTFSDVYAYSLSAQTETRLTTLPVYKSSVHIQGQRVVWTDYRHAITDSKNASIYSYNLSTRQESPVCLAAGFQDQPCLSGNVVVWQDFRNAGTNSKNADLFSYNFQTQMEAPVCTAPGYQAHPKVGGRLVVWQDYRNTVVDTMNADIYLYDLGSRTEIAVTNAPGFQDAPDLSGNRVVWMDYTDSKVHTAIVDTSTGAIRIIQKGVLSEIPFGQVYDFSGRKVPRSLPAGPRIQVSQDKPLVRVVFERGNRQ